MRIAIFFAAIFIATPACAQQAVPEPISGCAPCHGADGIARFGEVPILAGQNAPYLLNQLHAFQTGKRAHKEMRIFRPGNSRMMETSLAHGAVLDGGVHRQPLRRRRAFPAWARRRSRLVAGPLPDANEQVALEPALTLVFASRRNQARLPEARTADDVAEALGAVVNAMASGELTPDEASMVASVLEVRRKDRGALK